MKRISKAAILSSIFLVFGTAFVLTFQNCAPVDFKAQPVVSGGVTEGSPSTTPGASTPGSTTPNTPSPGTSITTAASGPIALQLSAADGFVCAPFGGNLTVPSNNSGLKAELRYIMPSYPGDKNAVTAIQYFNDANLFIEKVPQAVYLQDINVPTRKFTSGFAASNGSLIMDNASAPLVEYFGLKMQGSLVLGSNDPEGYYELATVSDDGAVLQALVNGVWTDIVSADGTHSTKMGCSNQKFYMTKTTRLPLRLYYFQGPRDEIANVLIWNYRGTSLVMLVAGLQSVAAIQKYCGVPSSSDYWTPSTSAPSVNIIDMLNNQKWKIPTSVNFMLPDNEVNPCSYSTYNLNPALTVDASGNFNLTLAEAATISVNVFKTTAASKTLLQTTQSPANTQYMFSLAGLSSPPAVGDNLSIEITMTIDAKHVSVLKTYAVKVTAGQ